MASIAWFLLVTKAEEQDTCYIHQREKNGNPELSEWEEIVEIWTFWHLLLKIATRKELCIFCLFLNYTLQMRFFFKENTYRV